ncbi:alanine:cation symporter family protein [Nocardioidaceae bacterium]|nr:alanine:cation symporter family protein [Nocardioidaceae bacterium]
MTPVIAQLVAPLERAVTLAAEGDEPTGFIPRLEEAINSIFEPVAEVATNVIFFSFTVGGVAITPIVFWLVIAAVIFTIYFKAPQVTGLRTSWDLVRGKYSRASDPGEVTHFQALSSALSGTVGLGNIAGVAVAMTVGGAGALFWMVVAGLLGMCTKFVECTLGVRYRIVHEDGTVTGGPFTYLPVAYDRLGQKLVKNPSDGMRTVGRILNRAAVAGFAIALLLFGALGGNAFQSNQTFAQAREITGGEGGLLDSALASLIFGLILAGLVGVVIIGGVKSIGAVTSRLVPIMGLLYVGACLFVIGSNLGQVPSAAGDIITGAFGIPEVSGGVIGVLIVGFQRAAFSNEAGVGSAPIVHSAVKTKHPVSEGYVALLEPFIDTVVICSMTALTIIIAGVPQYTDNIGSSISNDAGVVLTSRSFDTFIPGFDVMLTIAVALFAFSTLITWSYYTLKAWTTLVGRSRAKENAFKIIFLVFTVLGAVVNLGSVLDFADAMLFVCALFNLAACYVLLPIVREEVRNFRQGRQSGDIAVVPVEERATT